MTTSVVDADSLLALDIGTVTTRALLFDVVEGRYRFLAAGTAPTTAEAPFNDISEGVRRALDHLQSITGRILVDAEERLIVPASEDGKGIDSVAAVLSTGPSLRLLVVGLLEDVSLESACRLARTIHAGPIETLSLHDRRKPEIILENILKLRPNMVLIAGGTEGGANQSLLNLIEPLGLGCYLMPEDRRPEIIYAGNSALQDEVEATLGKVVKVHYASNVRPTLEQQQLESAQVEVAQSAIRLRSRQLGGVEQLQDLANGNLAIQPFAFGRLIRFLSRAYGSSKGVMGVDLGASSTTLATAFYGETNLGVYPRVGVLPAPAAAIDPAEIREVGRWLNLELPEEMVRDYLYNQSLYPESIPTTPEEMAIVQAAARVSLQQAVRQAAPGFSSLASRPLPNLLPAFEPILAAGSTLVKSSSMSSSAMMLLDGLQPTGITTLVLDQNFISSALGAAAAVNPVLAVQVMDSNTFQFLGTVISPVCGVRPGTPVLRVKMTYASGHETLLDVKQGSLEALPLSMGQTAQLQLQPLHRADIGMGGPGRGGKLKVQGGALGVVIDARGRPLRLPSDVSRRVELFKKWLWTLGG